jgi:hypothetical protein
MMGREMQEIVPVAFLPENHALAIAAMSYNGKLDFGLLADYDAIPDLERMAEFFEESLDELLKAAEKACAKPAAKKKAKPKARRPTPKSGPASSNGASSDGRGAKRSAIRGKAQRPRLIDSD